MVAGRQRRVTAGQHRGAREIAGKPRKRLALEQLGELVALDQKVKALSKEAQGDGQGVRLEPDGPIRCRADPRRLGSWPKSGTWPGRRPKPVASC